MLALRVGGRADPATRPEEGSVVEGTLTGEGVSLLKRFATKRLQGAEQGLGVFSSFFCPKKQ